MEPNSHEILRWVKDRGDETLRLEYDLAPDSIVVDIGTYDGLWTKAISDRFGCYVTCFEPIPSNFDKAKLLLGKMDKIEVHQQAFWTYDGTRQMFDYNDASSARGLSQNAIQVQCISGSRYLLETTKERPIDLLKINVEGDEYDILDDILLSGCSKKIRNFQIQFHWDGIPNYENRLLAVRQMLAKTHYQIWKYELVWESWVLFK